MSLLEKFMSTKDNSTEERIGMLKRSNIVKHSTSEESTSRI